MLPGSHLGLESAARALSRQARADHPGRRRAATFTPPEWPPSRGPTPNPRRP